MLFRSIGSMFRNCVNLQQISKIAFPNTKQFTAINANYNAFIDIGKTNATGKVIINYLDFGKALSINKNNITNSAYGNMFTFGGSPTPVKINFQCDIGTAIEKTGWFNNIKGLPDVETLNSFADHALTLDSAYTLKVSKNIYSIFTSEILAKLSAKNWTIASA